MSPFSPPALKGHRPVRLEELAKTIDHTLLRADATAPDVERFCEEAAEYHFAAVCVFPHWVPLATAALNGADVKVCAVISFPFGADTTRVKVAAVEEAVGQGAGELDVVMNIQAMLSGEAMFVATSCAASCRRRACTRSTQAGAR